ncbi:DUF5696 domain-containing protein [Paenibacillus polysaccharolyticus]|uniref:DUF5696 domain-containing protein n=1 Tax=Paenibacillus polysaccharolyticus TaxID=582692 RepID=UPI00203CAAB6|nr:DUF5696 domain-containing protein [Paenibacillus polysaccharolyticus]MCM3132147.1 DUF5696 domain-containing protein [Paenibacillus polysaccharolyticus]
MRKKRTALAAAILIASLFMSQNVNYAESVSERVATTSGDSQETSKNTSAESSETQQSPSEQVKADASREGEEQSAATSSGAKAASTNQQNKEAVAVAEGMEAVAEKDGLILYLKPETTEIAVKDKKNGAMWFSNPQDREADAIATGYNKSQLNVQFELTYYDNTGNALKYDNFTHSVESGQFEVEKVEDGLNIVYTLGEVKSDIEAIPKYISEERFNTLILAKLEEKDQKEIEKRFKYDEKNKRFERRDSSLKGVGLSKVTRIFESIGYDEAQIAIDKAAYGEEENVSTSVVVPVHYRLEQGRLRVSIPENGIQYPDTMKIQSLSLLPFFGASGPKDEGYSLVPDGSGSLIYFNNKKTSVSPYSTVLYGSDHAVNQLTQIQKEQKARMPVFGMSYGDKGYLAVIDKGDAVASVEADVSGRLNQYNTVHSSFALSSMEEVTLTNGWRSSTVKRFQAQPFHNEMAVVYEFLGAEDASYSGMASTYREYLTEQKKLTRLGDDAEMPFYVELIGGIPKKKFFLGIPYNAYEPLTTFEEAQDILKEMQSLGVQDIQLRYSGWFGGGIHHNMPKSIDVDKKLGGAKGLQSLQAYAQENGFGLYPDVSFLEAFPEAKGFKKSYASRQITGKLAQLFPYRISTFAQDDEVPPGYVLSPEAVPGIVNGFLQDFKGNGLTGLSLRDLGDQLNSDFNRAKVINREQAKQVVIKQLEKVRSSDVSLLVEGGNSYAIPYARHIVDAPVSNSGFNITDEAVPFFQLVYHGYVQYTGQAWNMADDQDSHVQMLRAIETGSAPYYTWFYADPSAIKLTSFDALYSADYRRWIQESAERYKELRNVLQDVQNQTIVKHEKLSSGVYQTTYEKGKTVIVNYNDAAVEWNGIRVAAKSYWVGGDMPE